MPEERTIRKAIAGVIRTIDYEMLFLYLLTVVGAALGAIAVVSFAAYKIAELIVGAC